MNDLIGLGKALEPFTQGSVGLLRRLFGEAASEIGEVFADKVRAYRRNNLAKILENVGGKIGDREFEALPLRFSIPFSEKASLVEDDELAEMWANLLHNAAVGFAPEHISFINILARLSPAEAKLLDRLIPEKIETESETDVPDYVVFKQQNDGAREVIPMMAGIISRVSLSEGGLSEEGREIAKFVVNRDFPNLIVEWMRASALDIDDKREWMAFNDDIKNHLVSIDLLQAEGLAVRTELHRSTTEVSISTSVITATALGWMFTQSCRAKERTE